jgi:hypothetical protein
MGASQLDFHVLMCQSLVDLPHAGGRIALHRQRPPQQDASLLDAVHQSLRRGEGHQRVGTCVGGRYVPAGLREHGGKVLH